MPMTRCGSGSIVRRPALETYRRPAMPASREGVSASVIGAGAKGPEHCAQGRARGLPVEHADRNDMRDALWQAVPAGRISRPAPVSEALRCFCES